MKLNKKGYMLVEIIIASVLAMSIVYYLLNLTYKFKNTNEDLYHSYQYMSDKISITKNIMNDLERGTILNVNVIEENKEVNFSFKVNNDNNIETRKLLVENDNNNTIIKYGKLDGDKFDTKDVSYYEKKIDSSLIVEDISIIYDEGAEETLTMKISIKSIYDDEDYSINLYAQRLKLNVIKATTEKNKEWLGEHEDKRSTIKRIYFVAGIANDAKDCVPINAEGSGVIKFWFDKNETDLYIGSENKEIIYFNPEQSSFFESMVNLETIDFTNLDTSLVTDMAFLFKECSNLKGQQVDANTWVLDLSNFDTSDVTNMESMFNGCSSLTNLNLSSFNTSNVTNMRFMFKKCSSLIELDLSNFNTGKVTSMKQLFQNCSSLTSLDLSNFVTSNVTSTGSMFDRCSSLIELDLSNFNTSEVTSMTSMFYECRSLTSLDVSGFDTSNVTAMNYVFFRCSKLETLDVSNWNTSKVTDMNAMFYECRSLMSLDLSGWNTSKVTNMQYMFCNCGNLTNLDLSGWNTGNVEKMTSMFYGSTGLKEINISGWNTSKVTDMSGMFAHCLKLERIVGLEDLDTSNVTSMGEYKDAGSNLHKGMFASCYKLTGTITISNPNTTYLNIFYLVATNTGAQLTVNYTPETSDLVDAMIATKSSNSNVKKEKLVS